MDSQYKNGHKSATGSVLSVNINNIKKTRKHPVPMAKVLANHGFEGDAHAGEQKRQISLLAVEGVQKAGGDFKPGDFAENITTKGIDLSLLSIGSRIKVGESVLLEIEQIGKECHGKCSIYFQTGDCIMPREGIFASVVNGGEIKVGDPILHIK